MMEMIKEVMITQVPMIYTTASKKEVRNFIFYLNLAHLLM